LAPSSPQRRSDLPASGEPVRAARDWLEHARGAGLYRNPAAMALATADAEGRPAVRMVLVKDFAVDEGFATFYTNYESRKAHELALNARAAGVLYWEQLGRQLRLEGVTVKSPPAESDAYFATRQPGSQVNAWVSEQSRPIADFAELERRMRAKRAELEAGGADWPRPAHWGGYRIWLDRVEFWIEGRDRFHERVLYERTLSAEADGFRGGKWTRTLLQP
jgi:pyridoxamine 5'-phosphate oxidase